MSKINHTGYVFKKISLSLRCKRALCGSSSDQYQLVGVQHPVKYISNGLCTKV